MLNRFFLDMVFLKYYIFGRAGELVILTFFSLAPSSVILKLKNKHDREKKSRRYDLEYCTG